MKAAWTGFLLSLSLCLDLGLVNVAVLRVSLERGARAGFLLGLGSGVGDLVYFTLSVFGALLSVASAILFLYFAVMVFRDGARQFL